ncbi:MAG TPA: fluoride efflux transporter CrcB [Oscillatoriaceae cyanobacterium]
MQAAIMVALGGILGALSRYYLTMTLTNRLGAAFPWATLIINVTGCFLLALISTLAAERTGMVSPELRLLLAVGFCGAYTTFSTFGFETFSLLRAGSVLEAIGYMAMSNLVGLAAVVLGAYCARALP